jgi:hypothetical protein
MWLGLKRKTSGASGLMKYHIAQLENRAAKSCCCEVFFEAGLAALEAK